MLAIEYKTKIEEHAIAHCIERLVPLYAGRHSAGTVRATVERIAARYAGADVQAFVPVLVERDARRLLDIPE